MHMQPDEAGQAEKIHKLLAGAGIGSRRAIEGWIAQGRVTVNGEPAHVGQRVTVKDKILVDGARVNIVAQTNSEILLLNKATGVICSRHDTDGRPTIFDDLPSLRNSRWISVGRLDMHTSGLLLMTNDGDLAHKLMHPSTGLDREYAVRVNVRLDQATLAQLQAGVSVDGEVLKFSDIKYYDGSGNNYWYHVVLLEGKNREVRRLFEWAGCTVSRLKRVRYGPVILPSWLRNGQWTSLQSSDLQTLYRLLGLRYRVSKKKQMRQPRVAKTSCLLPYPKLSQPVKSQPPKQTD